MHLLVLMDPLLALDCFAVKFDLSVLPVNLWVIPADPWHS